VLAITRDISASLESCELTHVPRVPIDLVRARAQHAAYEHMLQTLGCTIHRLPADDTMPDSVFIEDTAIVVDEVAIVTRPGAVSRRGEVTAVADALRPHRRLVCLEPPATLDGGDVLIAGRRVFVGRTARTNGDGVAQLQRALEPFGYRVTAVPVERCLHLKSAVTAVDDDLLLMNPAWIDPAAFPGVARLDVDPREPAAANVLRVGGPLLYASAFPRTRDRLVARGFDPALVDASELAKAEGAVTCCSLLVGDV
jgi:dimethylargininase